MYEQLKGVFPPMATPFSRDGQIEYSAVREQVEFLISAGVHGIVCGGSGGEGHTLDSAEFQKLMGTVSETIKGRVPFVAGVIVNSTAQAIARAHLLEGMAVDALQVTPVHYLFKPDEEATLKHFRTVWEAAQVPMLIYNVIPWNYLSPDLLLRIMREVPGVIGVKQSAGDLKLLADLIDNAREEDLIFTAIDALLYPSYTLGARGSISALLAAIPHSNVALWDAVKAGDHGLSLDIHKRQLRLWNAMPHEILPACVKYAQTLQGVPGLYSRAPMSDPSEQQKTAIRKALEDIVPAISDAA
jgi:4-hydroxy-tetrahydrodipicolinate synthase